MTASTEDIAPPPADKAPPRPARSGLKRALQWLSLLFGTACLLLCALLFWALVMLRAAPEEWSFPLRVGPWTLQASVPTTYRLLTHPVALKAATRLMRGRVLETRWGPVSLLGSDGETGPWELECQPCLLALPSLGPQPVPLSRLSATFQRNGQDHLKGDFIVSPAQPGPGSQPLNPVKGRWHLQMARQQAELGVELPPTPARDLAGLWSSQLPEWPRAQIDGRIRLDARWQFPRTGPDPADGKPGDKINLQVEGFAVSGLGTEALRTALPPGCAGNNGKLPDGGWGPWLPKAVLAAEDQRFMEHPGFDLAELQAAWTSNQSADRKGLRGGSTLSQQLAKMAYTGDERHALRKLRELLYAVELDRTLGKARVLDLYLAMAPWGQGQCGAAAAAKHYFKKPVQRLGPVEAAWLAGLLRAPEHELSRWAEGGPGRDERTAWILKQMRTLPPKQRQALVAALPEWPGPVAAGTGPSPRKP